MRVVVSYKQTWVPENELVDNLSNIRNILNNLGVDNYIFYFDEARDLGPKDVIVKATHNIKNSDLVIAFISHKDRSEWQLIELGITKGLWKKILLIIKDEVKDDYILIYWLNDDLIIFKDTDELNSLLTNYFTWK